VSNDTGLSTAQLDGVLDHLRENVRADGILLHLDWDGATALVTVDFADVDCEECVLPPGTLQSIIEARLQPNLPDGASLVVRDSRSTDPRTDAAPPSTLVLDPTGRPEGGNPDRGPDAGSIAGRTVGFRVDILWRSWDWVADEWQKCLANSGATTQMFRHIQGLAGAEGAEHHSAFAHFLSSLDVAIVGLGNCGSCTSWTIKDAVAAADRGCATVAVVTSEFEGLGRTLAAQYGRPNLRFLVLPYPLDTRPETEVRDLARKCFPQLSEVLGIVA
jgi:Fe-S cluster biogenesis protein NfuA